MPWRSILSETGGTAEYNLVMLQSHLPLAQSQRPGDARKKKSVNGRDITKYTRIKVTAG